MSKIYNYYLSTCSVYVAPVAEKCCMSFYNVPLSPMVPFCVQGTRVRAVSGYNDVIPYGNSKDYDIVIGLYIEKLRPNRQDPFTKIITIGYKNNRLYCKYDSMYKCTLLQLISKITNSLNIKSYTVTLSALVIKLQFPDVELDCYKILEHVMVRNCTLFPRERSSISKHNVAKLIHLISQSKVTIRNAVMDSVTLSIKYNVAYMSRYLSVTIDILDSMIDDVNNILDDVVAFISSICNEDFYIDNDNNLRATRHISSTKYMRSMVHDLFVQRFSRESSKNIIISDDDNVNTYTSLGLNALKYEGRWYVSKDPDMYVGLKINRLSNRHIYKYIPTIYKRDHSKIPGSNTYNYINGIDTARTRSITPCNAVRELYPMEIGAAPNCVLNLLFGAEHDACNRVGLPSCINGLFSCDNVGDNIFVVAKQELPHISVEQIKSMWYEDNNWHYVKYLYRIIEEMYNINVVIINDVGDDIEVLNYDELYRYIWNPKLGYDMVVLLRTRLNEYKIGYEIISYSETSITIPSNTYLYAYLLSIKMSSCARYNPISNVINVQYLNSEGKCVGYIDNSGIFHTCLSAPSVAKYIMLSNLPSSLDNSELYHKERMGIVRYNAALNAHDHIDNGYDDVVTIDGIKYYRSEVLPNNYIPYVIRDMPDIYKTFAQNEEDVTNVLSVILVDNNSYRYILRMDYIEKIVLF